MATESTNNTELKILTVNKMLPLMKIDQHENFSVYSIDRVRVWQKIKTDMFSETPREKVKIL